MNLLIRPESPQDFKAIRQVVYAAFEQAQHSDGDEHNLVERLRQDPAYLPSLALVALDGAQIVGHCMLTRLTIGDSPCKALALAPVAVLPSYQGKGIGSKLIQQAISQAALEGFDGIVVLGHAAYYPRFGFVPASRFGILCPFPVEDANFMALSLREDGLKNAAGTVHYAGAFFPDPPFPFEIHSTQNPISPEDFERVWGLMDASFPASERRDYTGQKALLNKDCYHLLLHRDSSGQIIAFMAIWRLDGYSVVEHLAVDGAQRGSGLGGKFLDAVAAGEGQPIVLEVEPPENGEMARRRIGFYQRHGFHLCTQPYLQPSLQPQFPFMPLMLMTYPDPLEEMDFGLLKAAVYRDVYGLEE